MFEILEDCCTPQRGTKFSAYVDLFSREDYVIASGETKIIKLGVKLDLEQLRKMLFRNSAAEISFAPIEYQNNLFSNWLLSHYLEVALRSSLAVKGLIIANGIGIIDLDYPDEIGLIVHNPIQRLQNFQGGYCEIYPDIFYIDKGNKVAQCTIKEHKGYLMGCESDIVRTSGFGSTGK